MEAEEKFFSIAIKNPDGSIREKLEVEESIDSVANLINFCQRQSVPPLQQALFDENMNEISEESFLKVIHENFVLLVLPSYYFMEQDLLLKLEQKNQKIQAMEEQEKQDFQAMKQKLEQEKQAMKQKQEALVQEKQAMEEQKTQKIQALEEEIQLTENFLNFDISNITTRSIYLFRSGRN